MRAEQARFELVKIAIEPQIPNRGIKTSDAAGHYLSLRTIVLFPQRGIRQPAIMTVMRFDIVMRELLLVG
jgi:hypothetical protein